ncbi:MAG: glycosyltransferase family 4 protein [Burkholderiales bacterium]|nr:glycosyltransferase family 4 protein [Burkholderiales bacterium]
MRLAIIRQRYDPEGAAERFLEGALEALLERNVAITLYTRQWPATKLQLIEPTVVDPFHLGALWRDAGFARAVARSVASTRANLVQSHELVLTCDVYRPDDGVYATWLGESLRAASAVTRWRAALSPRHRYALAMERKLFASHWLRMVLCPSPLVRDDIRTRFGLPDERLRVLRNAVDTDRFSPMHAASRAATRERHGIAADTPVFVLVGSGYRRKGAGTAITALARLPAPAHLVIVGNDARRGDFERIARDHGVASRVTFAGYQADVAPYLAAADAFVLPALYDPSPDATMEAMASGLPVITSTQSGVADLVAAHDAGRVCAAHDTDAIAAAMQLLLDAPARAAMGVRAREAMLPHSPAATTLALVLVYKELLEASIAHKLAPKTNPAPATAAAEAPPLHGEFGLDAETLADPSGNDAAAAAPAAADAARSAAPPP